MILNLFVCRPLVRACFCLLLRWIVLEGVVFSTVRGVVVSRAGITVFVVAGFRAAPLTPALGLFLGGVVIRCSFAIPILWDIHHVYVI